MNKYLAILILLAVVGLYFLSPRNKLSVGSIDSDAFAYQATTTQYVWSSNGLNNLIKTGGGILGSVIIPNSTALGTLTLYDGTTTASHTDHATTTLAVINATAPGTAYPFDVAFSRGLLAVSSATLATSTITFK